MSTNAFALTPAEEAEVKTAADGMIRTAAQRANMTFDDVPQYARDDAYRAAKSAFEAKKAQESNPLWPELKAEREAHAQTQKNLAASQQVRPNAVSNSKSNLPDPEMIRARMGEGNWRALTNEGRLIACQLDPASITAADIEESKLVFGKHTSTSHAVNLSKVDFARYKRLKNIAIVAGYQGQ